MTLSENRVPPPIGSGAGFFGIMRYLTGSVIFSAALHKGASFWPRAVRQAIFWPSPMPVWRQCSARSRKQARPITAVITTGALGRFVAAGGGGGTAGVTTACCGGGGGVACGGFGAACCGKTC